MQTQITFINPNLVLQSNDVFTTGVVYMPISLAYFVAAAQSVGHACRVIDGFGEAPNQTRVEAGFIFRGLRVDEVCARIPETTEAVVVYAINLTYHRSLIQILHAVRARLPKTPIVVMENTQAVTAYALKKLLPELFEAGATHILTGEAEMRGLRLLDAIIAGHHETPVDGVAFRDSRGGIHFTAPKDKIAQLDGLAFPAWELFPLKNYWSLGYAHGPLSSRRYLPLLTSRGCPYACRFCVIPDTNNLKWRARSAVNLVDEIVHFQKLYDVHEFHIEDVDPTVNDVRIREFCAELERRDVKIRWKICAGTKVETLRDETTLEIMAAAGCNYISISPESGSPRVMKLINKPFKIDHAIRLIRKMRQVGIYSQACFVLGFPGEEDADRELTRKMALRLTKVGLDEIAIFIITPVPGSAIYDQFSGFDDFSQLNFSPTWRADYTHLNRFRIRLYREFLLNKLRWHPWRILKQPFNFLSRRFNTKMEMTPYRALHTLAIRRASRGTT